MKKALAPLVVLGLLVSLMIIAQFVDAGTANPRLLYFKPRYCKTSIHSPHIGIYNNGTIPINFTIITNCKLDTNLCHHILDGREEERVEDFQIVREEIISDEMMPDINTTYFAYTEYTFGGQILLSNLSYGTHKLSVQAQKSAGDTVAYETITFIIPAEPEPFSSPLVIASLITVIVVVFAVFLFYMIKRKH